MKTLKFALIGSALLMSGAAFANYAPEGNGHVDVSSYVAPEGNGHADIATNAAPEGNGHVDVSSYAAPEGNGNVHEG
jgi:hypothetical protein